MDSGLVDQSLDLCQGNSGNRHGHEGLIIVRVSGYAGQRQKGVKLNGGLGWAEYGSETRQRHDDMTGGKYDRVIS